MGTKVINYCVHTVGEPRYEATTDGYACVWVHTYVYT